MEYNVTFLFIWKYLTMKCFINECFLKSYIKAKILISTINVYYIKASELPIHD